MEWVIGVLFGLFVLVVVFLAFGPFFTVQQQSAAIVQRFGKFVRVANPGLNYQASVDRECRRAESTCASSSSTSRSRPRPRTTCFCTSWSSVQFHVLPDKVYDAFYRLADPHTQMSAFVFDVVRARVPRIKLDDVFEKKDEIADAVKNELSHVMYDFGYGIVKALVTDIEPDLKVKEAMNEINAAQRMRIAATEKGEAERILRVKSAEAEAQSKALQGRGIADQRRAIVEGLRESVDEFQTQRSGDECPGRHESRAHDPVF